MISNAILQADIPPIVIQANDPWFIPLSALHSGTQCSYYIYILKMLQTWVFPRWCWNKLFRDICCTFDSLYLWTNGSIYNSTFFSSGAERVWYSVILAGELTVESMKHITDTWLLLTNYKIKDVTISKASVLRGVKKYASIPECEAFQYRDICFITWTEDLVKSSRFQTGEVYLLSVTLLSIQNRAWWEHSRIWKWKQKRCFICISDQTDRSQMRPQRTSIKASCCAATSLPVSVMSRGSYSYFHYAWIARESII